MKGESSQDSIIKKKPKRRQPRNAECARNRLPQGGAYKLVIQYQMISPKSNITRTEQVVLMYLVLHTHTHQQLKGKKRHEFEREQGAHKRVWRGSGKEEKLFNYNLKIQTNTN